MRYWNGIVRNLCYYEKLIPQGIRFAIDNMNRYGNIFGASKKELVSWAKNLKIPHEGSRIFFASCMYSLMGQAEVFLKISKSLSKIGFKFESILSTMKILQNLRLTSIAKSLFISQSNKAPYYDALTHAIEVLNELGIECAYLYEDEPCCGAAYHTYGYLTKFNEHAHYFHNFLKERNVKEIITLNPICATIIKMHYPQFVPDFNITIRTFTEIVAQEINKKKLNLQVKEPIKVVFHDPCYQARYINQVNEIRFILKSINGLTIVEPINSKLLVRCCGAGGVEAVYPDISLEMARVRAQELIEVNADKIVTSCPVCILMLKLGLELLGVRKEVIDISTLIWRILKQGFL